MGDENLLSEDTQKIGVAVLVEILLVTFLVAPLVWFAANYGMVDAILVMGEDPIWDFGHVWTLVLAIRLTFRGLG
jgi:hypothetical protein